MNGARLSKLHATGNDFVVWSRLGENGSSGGVLTRSGICGGDSGLAWPKSGAPHVAISRTALKNLLSINPSSCNELLRGRQ